MMPLEHFCPLSPPPHVNVPGDRSGGRSGCVLQNARKTGNYNFGSDRVRGNWSRDGGSRHGGNCTIGGGQRDARGLGGLGNRSEIRLLLKVLLRGRSSRALLGPLRRGGLGGPGRFPSSPGSLGISQICRCSTPRVVSRLIITINSTYSTRRTPRFGDLRLPIVRIVVPPRTSRSFFGLPFTFSGCWCALSRRRGFCSREKG